MDDTDQREGRGGREGTYFLGALGSFLPAAGFPFEAGLAAIHEGKG